MNIKKSLILNNITISPELFILEVLFEGDIQAGQFVMIKVPDNTKILPRPISVFDYDITTQKLSLLIRKRGAGTELLARCKEGDYVTIFGSMGQGFPTAYQNKNILLMGGGEGIAPMLLTSKLLATHNNLTIFGGFRYEIESTVLDYFDENIPTKFTAQDHSQQCHRGLITDLLEDIIAPDYIFCCGPIPMMKAIYQYTQKKQWHTQTYISMESHMACGVGACMGCSIKDAHNQPLKVCTEGPVFIAEEVFHA